LSRTTLALENAALREQLTIYQRNQKHPRLRIGNRASWVVLRRLWSGWKHALIVVRPETVIAGHCQGFKLFWRHRSISRKVGRPRIPREHTAFIQRISADHPEWGEDKIAEELDAKCGIHHSAGTVRRYMARRTDGPRKTQTWHTFIQNHAKEVWVCDILTRYTAFFAVVYVFVMEVASYFLGSYHYPNEKRPYWDRVAHAFGDVSLKFLEDHSLLDAWMGDLLTVSRDSTKDVDRCLELVHRDIVNLDLLEEREMPEKVPDRSSVDDVIKHRLGSHEQIGYLFLAMLRRLGHEAAIFWTRDRTHGVFLKTWQAPSQFTMGGVVVKRGETLQWLFPALPFTDGNTIPWQATGCRALLENLSGKEELPGAFETFADIPMGQAEWNKISLEASLQVDSLGRAVGRLTATWDCASDPAFPLRISKKTKKEAVEELRGRALWSGAKWTRMDESATQSGRTVAYSCSLTVDNLLEDAGARRIVNLGLLRADAYRLPEGARESTIQFQYPVRYLCTISLTIPDGYTIDRVPERSLWQDDIGSYNCESVPDQGVIVRRRGLRFSHDLYRPQGAPALRAFFEKVYAADGEPVVLKRVGGDE
jgi:hypothetical protein